MGMIISKTPYRITFFGGSTDYETWFRKHGGATLSTTIDKYCYVNSRILTSSFPIKHRVVWSKVEMVDRLDDIEHPAMREGLKFVGYDDTLGFEVHHQGDLPSRSGIGSSSSFLVGLLNTLFTMQGKHVTAKMLATQSTELAHGPLSENVGLQDQIAAAYGGFNLVLYHQDSSFSVIPIETPQVKALESRLLLFHTGILRVASNVAGKVIQDIPKRQELMHKIHLSVFRALEILFTENGDLDRFGVMLDEYWQMKRQLSAVISTPEIDDIYTRARHAGAIGGKLMGAGSGGFMLFYVPEDKQEYVIRSLKDCVHVPFKFEAKGSEIVYKEDGHAR